MADGAQGDDNMAWIAAAWHRCIPRVMMAGVAVIALGLGYLLIPGLPGRDSHDAGGMAAGPVVMHVEVPLQFAPGSDRLPDGLTAALSQVDPCGADVRLDVAVEDGLAARRAAAVAAELERVSGRRCRVHVVTAVEQRLPDGAAELAMTH